MSASPTLFNDEAAIQGWLDGLRFRRGQSSNAGNHIQFYFPEERFNIQLATVQNPLRAPFGITAPPFGNEGPNLVMPVVVDDELEAFFTRVEEHVSDMFRYEFRHSVMRSVLRQNRKFPTTVALKLDKSRTELFKLGKDAELEKIRSIDKHARVVPVVTLKCIYAGAMGWGLVWHIVNALSLSDAIAFPAGSVEEKNHDNDPVLKAAEKEQCKICMDAKLERVCIPCGHFCMCTMCANAVMNKKPSHCPICRANLVAVRGIQQVKQSVQIFII